MATAAVLSCLFFSAAAGYTSEYKPSTHAPSSKSAPHSSKPESTKRLQLAATLPTNFTWSNVKGTNYLTQVLNQHLPNYCGSCWVFATLSSLGDRIKISREAQGPEIHLSMQHVLNCGTAGTCNGGNHIDVYAWIHTKSVRTGTGVAYDSVNPYIACSGGNPHIDGMTEGICLEPIQVNNTMCLPVNIARDCATFGEACTPLASYPNATIAEYGSVAGEAAMMAEIYNRGPIACELDAEPIVEYTHGILTHAPTPSINHVASIVGWGEEGGVPYWIVRNSWGESWGELGFFRVKRGENLLGLEGNCAWATPGAYTLSNVPCFEDGSNCLPDKYEQAVRHHHPYGSYTYDAADTAAGGARSGRDVRAADGAAGSVQRVLAPAS